VSCIKCVIYVVVATAFAAVLLLLFVVLECLGSLSCVLGLDCRIIGWFFVK